MKNLFIAVDPGFDTMKVVANGITFKFPFSVVQTDERKLTDYRLRDDLLLYQDARGTTYRVGQYAREILYDNHNQESLDGFYTEQRFISEEFTVGLNTAIALAIDKSGSYEYQEDLNIHLCVALPHACVSTYSASIIGAAAGRHQFSLRCGDSAPRNFRYTIHEKQVHTLSQTISAILGETSDDNGTIDAEKFHYLSNGPTLVLDGGYYTMGIVIVSRGGSVDEEKTESNTDFAMRNVNHLVSDAIHDKRPEITHNAVEYLMEKDDGKVRYLDKDSGKAVAIDLKALRAEKSAEVCGKLIEYLNEKFNNLLDVTYVLVTGGTGAVFYPQLLDYYRQAEILDESHLTLTSVSLDGATHPIEYAVAVGAYKGLRGLVN